MFLAYNEGRLKAALRQLVGTHDGRLLHQSTSLVICRRDTLFLAQQSRSLAPALRVGFVAHAWEDACNIRVQSVDCGS